MATEKYSLDIDAPASKIWAALSDFSNIQLFHPNVKYTDQLSKMDRGLGASRRCNFYDGGSAVESITAWDDDRRSFTCTVTEIAAPITDVVSGMSVEKIDSSHSRVHIYMNYTVKFGVLGKILNAVVLRFVLQAVFKKTVKGLALHVATGKTIGKNGQPVTQFSKATN